MTESVVRIRPGQADDGYGGTTASWADDDVDRLTIDGCLIAPLTEAELVVGGRQGVMVGWTVYAPDGVDVAASDRLDIRGTEFDVDGEPADWSGGWEWKPGVVIHVRRGTG